jgi:hypothetical protein
MLKRIQKKKKSKKKNKKGKLPSSIKLRPSLMLPVKTDSSLN